ncbi:MAG: diguanylate cyclase, partial [Candidatus Enteromonas sp.]|nr:diguanylate cyclase [Candidatus Enteromonas sp.]
LGWEPNRIQNLKYAASLHDIGKTGIPDTILNKPARLTPDEYALIQKHTVIGAEILKNIAFVPHAVDIARYHHERYDGRGYPDGLKGDAIPVWAQIVGLADVYDALTSVRCYKRAFSHEEAIAMIKNGECGAFSPFLLQCFEAIQDKIPEIIAQLDASGEEDASAWSSDASVSDERDASLLLQERQLRDRFANLTDETWFRFELGDHQTITFNRASQKKFGFPLTINDPFSVSSVFGSRNQEAARTVEKAIQQTTPEEPSFEFDLLLHFSHGEKWFHVIGEAIFSERRSAYLAIGRIADASEIVHAFDELSSRSSRIDSPTLLDEENLSLEQAESLLHAEQQNFDLVRLISYELKKEYRLEEGKFLATMDFAPFWDDQAIKGKPVLIPKKTTRAFRLHARELYFVVSRPLTILNAPYTLEMISRIDEDSVASFSKEDEGLYSVAALSYALYRDSTLGCKTRRFYDEKAKDRVGNYCLAILDMDDFKRINDTYGHEAGDEALKKVVEAIRSCVRAEDEIIRYGGDEFLLLFEDMPRRVLENKLESILSHIRAESVQGLALKASAGAVRGKGRVAELFEKADSALYIAKESKGTFHIIDEGEEA